MRDPEQFLPWLYAIARNAASSIGRRVGRTAADALDPGTEPVAPEVGPEQLAELAMLVRAARDAMIVLSQRDATVLTMATSFGLGPKEIAVAGDQVFHQVLTAAGLNGGRVEDHTVDYLCLWENIYRLIGEEPPEGARPPAPLSDLKGWLDGLEPKRRRVVGRLIGIDR